ncbi:twin-arginine translocation signal domain-containing protein [Halorussus sp. AFM4]|uniref:twin-arginine translocation signal domain-containing protein n=1 Tax=Halorussus sp. AFM4 TaxID=3421651 RepID=UPI003EBFDDD1
MPSRRTFLAALGGAGVTAVGGSRASELARAVDERVPPDADAVGLGALLGGGAVAAGRRLLGDD